jgi:hypothetical protein
MQTPFMQMNTRMPANSRSKKSIKKFRNCRQQKQKHVDLAQKYQSEGDRWQYNTGRISDAHAAWAKADDERAQAIALQLQIDHLLERKERIYQFYPQLEY